MEQPRMCHDYMENPNSCAMEKLKEKPLSCAVVTWRSPAQQIYVGYIGAWRLYSGYVRQSRGQKGVRCGLFRGCEGYPKIL